MRFCIWSKYNDALLEAACVGAFCEGTHRLLQWCVVVVVVVVVIFLSYRHTRLCPRVHLTRWGSESRQESEEARGGRMQHQGEGGRRWRRGRKLKSQNLERKEDRRKRWSRKRRRRRRERASPVEQQVGRYERRWGVGRWRVLESRQAGGGGDVQEETHQQRGFEFQSSSKMMSFSQKNNLIPSKQTD